MEEKKNDFSLQLLCDDDRNSERTVIFSAVDGKVPCRRIWRNDKWRDPHAACVLYKSEMTFLSWSGMLFKCDFMLSENYGFFIQ